MFVNILRRQALQSCMSSLSFHCSLRCHASKSFLPHTLVTMPALSPTMTAGNIGTWQKTAGDSIVPGDNLVEIETDKAQMNLEIHDEGILAKILKESGEQDVAVGTVCAQMTNSSIHWKVFIDRLHSPLPLWSKKAKA